MKYTTLLGFCDSELIAVSSLACEINVVGANNALDAARIAGVQRVYNVAKPHFDGYDENSYTLNQACRRADARLSSDRIQNARR